MRKDIFFWHSFDYSSQLDEMIGSDWDSQIVEFAKRELKNTPIIPRSTTSREADSDLIIQAAVVDGEKIKEGLNWLYKLYRFEFLALAKKATGKKLSCASNDLYGINLNIQTGTSMRYECHVDSNPLQGMFYVTNHDSSTGGALHVANYIDAKSVDDVNVNCAVIEPKKGRLIFFDARRHSHYVSNLQKDSDIRVAVAMNFYSPDSPESQRPRDLSKHLGLV